ncbi:MAG: T9SS type A sorting domain-containing protein [Vicingaceae bacterium]
MKKSILILLLLFGTQYLKAQQIESAFTLNGTSRSVGSDSYISANGELYTLLYFTDSLFIPQLQKVFFSSTLSRSAWVKQSASGLLLMADTLPTRMNNNWLRKGPYFYTYGYQGSVAKYDSLMNLIWDKKIPLARAVAVDQQDNLHACGHYQVNIDLDPDSATSYPINSQGYYDIFNVKLNSSGNFLSGSGSGGIGADFTSDIVSDEFSNTIDVGGFFDQAYFPVGSNTLLHSSAVNQSDAYIRKRNKLGGLIWISQLKGVGNGANVVIDAIEKVSNGDLLVAGGLTGTVDFNPSNIHTQNLTASNYRGDAFLLRLDSLGQLKWVKLLVGNLDEDINEITTDANGDIYLIGEFEGTVDFDPGIGLNNHTSLGATDGFVLRLDSVGTFKSVLAIGSTSFDAINSISVKDEQNILICGEYGAAMSLPSASGVIQLPAPPTSNYTHFFSAKLNWSNLITNITEAKKAQQFTIFPNPSTDNIRIEIPQLKQGEALEIRNLQGQLVHQQTVSTKAISLELGHLADGIYLLRYGLEQKKLVIQR